MGLTYNYTSNMNGSEIGGLSSLNPFQMMWDMLMYSWFGMGVIGYISFAFFLVGLAIFIGVIVFYLYTFYALFEKSGRTGWHAFIPVYNMIVLLEIAGMNPIWYILTLVFSVLTIVAGYILPIFAVIMGIVTGVIAIIFGIQGLFFPFKLAAAFEKRKLFALGLAIIPFAFFPLLALDEDFLSIYNVKNKNIQPQVEETEEVTSEVVMPVEPEVIIPQQSIPTTVNLFASVAQQPKTEETVIEEIEKL